MRIRFITERLESEGWKLDDSQYNKVIAKKDGKIITAENLNKLYFKIYKPKNHVSE